MKTYKWLLSKGAFYISTIFILFFFISLINKRYLDALIQLIVIAYFVAQGVYFNNKYIEENKIIIEVNENGITAHEINDLNSYKIVDNK